MAFVVADRVQENGTVATGTGSVNLSGAVNGYKTFVSGIGTTNSTYYAIYDPTAYAWEVGYGTVTAGSPNTLSRTTVLSNSSGTTSLISFSTSNTLTIFCTYPSEKAVIQDVNGNISGNSFTPGWTSTTTAAGTTTLTVASSYYQRFVGSTTQTVVLPAANTVALGQGYIIDNDSTGNVTLQDGSLTPIIIIVPGMAGFIFCENNGSVAGSWSGYQFVPGAGPSGAVTWGTTGLSMGNQTITNANWNGVAVPVLYGGTGATTISGAQTNLQVDPAGTAIAMAIALG